MEEELRADYPGNIVEQSQGGLPPFEHSLGTEGADGWEFYGL